PVVSILVSVLYQFLELSLITAVALMFGVFTSSLLATLLTFGVYMMGHLSRDLVELSKLSENPGIERMTETLYLVIPDLSRLNLKNDAVYGVLPPFPELFLNGLYGLLYIVLLLAIAILIFWQREF
ncbi:MAG: ABC transporter permease, partial [Moorea sp. SIO3I7]|nr:ABC transporter permease [Moorena sp. SIO3I7]